MTLADSVAAELPRWRAEAEALMFDAGQAKRPTGETVYDEGEQDMVLEYVEDFGFESRCKIQSRNLVARDEEVGARTATSVRLELHLPVNTEPLTTGDEWEITEAADISTASVGRKYRVTAPVEKTWPTARRYEVVAIVN